MKLDKQVTKRNLISQLKKCLKNKNQNQNKEFYYKITKTFPLDIISTTVLEK